MPSAVTSIERMPRGGPDASCLDRLLSTDRRPRAIRWYGTAEQFAHLALAEVADVPDPRILVLGTDQDDLIDALRVSHPTAQISLDAADGPFALAVLALSLHRLAPSEAADLLGDATRVADKLLIIDIPRPPAPLHLLALAPLLPLAVLVEPVADGIIGSLRSYSPSALRALADHAGADVDVRSSLFGPQIAVATRR